MSDLDLISRGTLVCDPATLVSSSRWPATAGLGVVSTGFPTGGERPTVALALQSLGAINTSYIEGVFTPHNLGVTNTTFRGVLVEVYNPSSAPTTFRFEFASGGTRRLYANLTCDVSDDWQLLWAPSTHTGPTFITPSTDPANAVDRIRPQFLYDAPVQEFAHVAGQNLYIGRVWINPVQRPVFLLGSDDGFDTNITLVGGRSFQSIVEARGFRYTVYAAIGKIGSPGYLTWDQCRQLRDAGHTIAHHSYAHPQPVSPMVGNYGLRLLGPFGYNLPTWTTSYPRYPGSAADDTAIYDDFVQGVEKLTVEGLEEGALHHALPQGEWDQYVRTALLRAGVKSVRAYSTYNRGFPIRGAQNCGGGHNNSAAYPTGWTELTGSVQLDGSTTQAQILQYVTEVERLGATGTAYTHSSTGFDNLEALCDRLKADQDNGLIRVMSVAEYYSQFDDMVSTPIQYQGPPRNNITRLSGTSTTIDPAGTYELEDTNAWRVVTGWTAGTANFGFNASGVPIPFSGQQAIDAGIGPRFYCGSKGIAGYTVDQDAAANAKIIRILKVPTYIDTLYWSDSAEMDWSATSE